MVFWVSVRGKSTICLLLFLMIIVLGIFNTGCATPHRPPSPKKTMTLTIDSIPTGADVYAYRSGERGMLIGITPLEIEVGANFDYDGKNYYVYFYSPDDCVTEEKINSPAGEGYELYLNCVLLKDGYAQTHVSNHLFTICLVHFGIDFQDENVAISFPLEPLNKQF